MGKLKGSMDSLSAMQITSEMKGLDDQCKTLLYHPEILAVILRDTVSEYKGYSWQEVEDFIETDSITNATEVSPGRTNTKIRRDNTEFTYLNEKTSFFDLAFRARNPLISTEDIQINLHIDIEPQKTYTPGYPIEKRGMYYLARRLSSQLSLAVQGTDYNLLTKCYSIWICRDDIPEEDCYSISVYETVNTKNTASNTVSRENYDLMTLVVIKLGKEVYNGEKEDEGYDLLRFLNAIMYPHKKDFADTVSEYIDYSEDKRLWKEVRDMVDWKELMYEGMTDEITRKVTEKLTKELTEEVTERVTEEVTEKVTEEVTERVTEEVTERVTEEVREEGIRAMILDNLEEQIPGEKISIKLQKHFHLTEEKAEQYYKKYVANV